MRRGVTTLLRWIPVLYVLCTACTGPGEETISGATVALTSDERVARLTIIRDTAAARGLTNGMLLAGIANAETGLAQCWSEATWACQGPASASCGGGPVIAGSGDGPCSLMQGGLGMFQFDGGTFSDTLARDGEGVLTTEGNVDHAVDFVINMVKKSVYIDAPIETDEDAIAWMNEVRPWNADYDTWIKTVTHYYNGCTPGKSCYASRIASYTEKGLAVYDEMGPDFWYGENSLCGPIGPGGAVLEETDGCFGAAGPAEYWRDQAGAGSGGALIWTHATDKATESNWAQYHLTFEEAGSYELEVYTDTAVAGSKQAVYEVTHGGQVERVVIDQTAVNGFQSLGVFEFAAGGEQRVRILDNTGEAGTLQRVIVADALRIGGAGAAPPRGEPEGLSSAGCSAAPFRTPVRDSWLWAGLGVLALGWRTRRRHV